MRLFTGRRQGGVLARTLAIGLAGCLLASTASAQETVLPVDTTVIVEDRVRVEQESDLRAEARSYRRQARQMAEVFSGRAKAARGKEEKRTLLAAARFWRLEAARTGRR